MKKSLVVCAIALALMPGTASADGSSSGPGSPVPVVVDGARRVDLRDANGRLTSIYSFPANSLVSTHGGAGKPCSFLATADGTTSDGQAYAAGQIISSGRWIFIEWTVLGISASPDPRAVGPLSQAFRLFRIFCDKVQLDHDVGSLLLPPTDPLIDPHTQLPDLYQRLQLARPPIYSNPEVNRYGGLVTRSPAWLAIASAGWARTVSAPVSWHGWTLLLIAAPVALNFTVTYTPKTGPPTTVTIPCIPQVPALADGEAMPRVPSLPAQTEPGVNGPCEWTPPGPGSVTIRATVTYTVTLWASGYTEAQPDYTWAPSAATYKVGNLIDVNTNN